MAADEVGGRSEPLLTTALRTQPRQERSSTRLDALLDVAAALIDEAGLSAVTTAALAARSDMSIGSVYRYFSDRVAVLQALADRNLQRYAQATFVSYGPSRDGYLQLMDAGIDAFAAMFRSEPGFRALRFGDVVDERLVFGTERSNDAIAATFAQIAIEQFGLDGVPDLRLHVGVVVEIADALLSRAFTATAAPDERFIQACREISTDYLIRHLGDPRT